MELNGQYHAYTQLVYGRERVTPDGLARRSAAAAEEGDATFYAAQADLVLRYALSDLTEVRLGVPARRLAISTMHDDEHHRNESMGGLGDLRLSVKHFFLTTPDWQAAGTLGVSLPTGRLHRVTAASWLEEDEEAALGITPERHSHLRLGSGTVDPLLGVEVLRRFEDGWMAYGSLTAAVPFTKNRYDYRTAPSTTLTAGPAAAFGESPVIGALFGEMTWQGRDQYDGADVVGTLGTADGRFGVPNTGRFEIAVLPSLTARPVERLTLNAQLRIPVYTRIREDAAGTDVQLTEHVGFFLGMTWSF